MEMPAEIDIYSERSIQWVTEKLGSLDYPMLCLGFVEDALEHSNGIVLDGYAFAKEAGEAYAAADDHCLPPRGSWVFYDCWGAIQGEYKNWGHVGISLGDGKVIHAWDKVRIDDFLELQKLEPAAGWTSPKYAGWAPLSAVLVGMRLHQALEK